MGMVKSTILKLDILNQLFQSNIPRLVAIKVIITSRGGEAKLELDQVPHSHALLLLTLAALPIHQDVWQQKGRALEDWEFDSE